jgi:hypothetical protein
MIGLVRRQYAASSGYTLVHQERVRASAIIGVTVSTHCR